MCVRVVVVVVMVVGGGGVVMVVRGAQSAGLARAACSASHFLPRMPPGFRRMMGMSEQPMSRAYSKRRRRGDSCWSLPAPPRTQLLLGVVPRRTRHARGREHHNRRRLACRSDRTWHELLHAAHVDELAGVGEAGGAPDQLVRASTCRPHLLRTGRRQVQLAARNRRRKHRSRLVAVANQRRDGVPAL